MHSNRPSRFLIAVLCLSLATPPVALAQSGASATSAANASTHAASSMGRSNLDTSAAAALRSSGQENADGSMPGNVADGVFGVYGGRESRLNNRPGPMSGLRAPLASRCNCPISAKLSAAAATQYLGGYHPDFDLFAVRDPQINAFSMPGGFIGVNTGLIVMTQTESELASVIGHEMGHVPQRHIARMITQQKHSSYAALAAMLAGLLSGVMARSGDLGMGIAMGGQAFAVDNQLRFSRAARAVSPAASGARIRVRAGAGARACR